MSDTWLVARREITVRARTRGFLVGLAVSALVVAVLAVLPKLFEGPDTYTVGLVASPAIEPAVRAQAAATDTEATVTFRTFSDEATARAAVTDGEIDAAVVRNTTLLSEGEVDGDLGDLLRNGHQAVVGQERLLMAGLDPAKVREALRVPPLREVSVTPVEGDSTARVAFATLVVVILFFLLMGSVTTVAMGVVEEKGSRIVELLLTSIRPWHLLSGKIIGLGALGLLNLLVIITVGVGASLAVGRIGELPPGTGAVLLAAVCWFLLAFAFFSTLAAALGALVSRQEEVGSVLTPLTTLLMATYLVAFYAVFEPAGTVARVLSLVPPFSSMIMPVRMAGAPVPLWEIGLAALLMVLAVLVVLRVGARIYERAVLRTGQRVRLRDVLR